MATTQFRCRQSRHRPVQPVDRVGVRPGVRQLRGIQPQRVSQIDPIRVQAGQFVLITLLVQSVAMTYQLASKPSREGGSEPVVMRKSKLLTRRRIALEQSPRRCRSSLLSQ